MKKVHSSRFTFLRSKKDSNQTAYSMIELLVVIAAMIILGVVVFANYRTLRQDQATQKAVSDIQSFIKVAQANATTRVPCPPNSQIPADAGAAWIVKFSTTNTLITMSCKLGSAAEISPSGGQYTYNLTQNVVVDKLNTNCSSSSLFFITFAPLYGNVTFGTDGTCLASPNFLITLKNTSNGATKVLVVDKGGSVYEQ